MVVNVVIYFNVVTGSRKSSNLSKRFPPHHFIIISYSQIKQPLASKEKENEYHLWNLEATC